MSPQPPPCLGCVVYLCPTRTWVYNIYIRSLESEIYVCGARETGFKFLIQVCQLQMHKVFVDIYVYLLLLLTYVYHCYILWKVLCLLICLPFLTDNYGSYEYDQSTCSIRKPCQPVSDRLYSRCCQQSRLRLSSCKYPTLCFIYMVPDRRLSADMIAKFWREIRKISTLSL